MRAFAAEPDASRALLEDALGFVAAASDAWEARGPSRGGLYAYDEPPAERGLGGAGTVHHVAWSSTMEEHEAWHERVDRGGLQPSPIIDRFWFRSIYFREPSGVLFEIATLGPGFSLDEDPEHLGETLILPPAFEHLRDAGRADPDADSRIRVPGREDERRSRAASVSARGRARRGHARGPSRAGSARG